MASWYFGRFFWDLPANKNNEKAKLKSFELSSGCGEIAGSRSRWKFDNRKCWDDLKLWSTLQFKSLVQKSTSNSILSDIITAQTPVDFWSCTLSPLQFHSAAIKRLIINVHLILQPILFQERIKSFYWFQNVVLIRLSFNGLQQRFPNICSLFLIFLFWDYAIKSCDAWTAPSWKREFLRRIAWRETFTQVLCDRKFLEKRYLLFFLRI